MPEWPPRTYPDHFYWSWATANRRIHDEIIGPAKRLLSRAPRSPGRSIQEAMLNAAPPDETRVGSQPAQDYELYRKQAQPVEEIGAMVGREYVQPGLDFLGKMWRGEKVLPENAQEDTMNWIDKMLGVK